MPDLTLVERQRCANKSAADTVTGSKGELYNVFVAATGNSCDCKGFEFRGTCKHVNALMLKLCGWDSSEDEPQTPQQEMMMQCPRCGGDTEMYREAV
jgi:uncharacterized Zn finger protein